MSVDENPTAEIEVTPEMIEAGATEFCLYEPKTESVEEVVVRIYEAMRASHAAHQSRMSLGRLPPSRGNFRESQSPEIYESTASK